MKKIAKLLGLKDDATEEQILDALKGRPDLEKVLEALELKAEATTEEILEAIESAKVDKDENPEVDLDAAAKKEGKVVLSADEVTSLKADAKAGKEANDKIFNRDFNDAYESALDEIRVDAKDETRKEWRELYELAPEQTLKRLGALPKLAKTDADGKGGGGADGEAPEGVDESRFELDKKAKAYEKEHKVSYDEALDAVIAGEAD
jgi:hypothetical protein